MPVITFSSLKGGTGKTTAACLLGSMLAERGASVTMIDADCKLDLRDWATRPGLPKNLKFITDATEKNLVDEIEVAAARSAFVVVDLEGAVSIMASYAISMSDLIVIPMQGSHLDAKHAARQINIIKRVQTASRRLIPFVLMFNRTNPTIIPKTQNYIKKRIVELDIPLMMTHLYDRDAFRAIYSYGGTLQGLVDKDVSNLDAAINNAAEFAGEVVQILRQARLQPPE